jgi:hypothetical protein
VNVSESQVARNLKNQIKILMKQMVEDFS